MNKAILMGRLTRDPEVRYSQKGDSQEATCIARYTLAVDRRGRDAGEDFISIVAFGRAGEFAEKHLRKGTKITISGRIQTGSYTNKDGVRIYTTDVVVDEQEFAESKAAAGGNTQTADREYQRESDGFMNIPDGIDEELPFT